jgi:uncharacterized cupin superfamily protein
MEVRNGEKYQIQRRMLGAAAGCRQLGCSLVELPPGTRSWPRHAHRANEEAIYVLEGTGVARIGEKEYPVGPGDFVALVAGGPEAAHQTINTGADPLKYLCFSTMISPEVVAYPDSDKTAFLSVEPATDGSPPKRNFALFKNASAVDYWDGEG